MKGFLLTEFGVKERKGMNERRLFITTNTDGHRFLYFLNECQVHYKND